MSPTESPEIEGSMEVEVLSVSGAAPDQAGGRHECFEPREYSEFIVFNGFIYSIYTLRRRSTGV